MNTFGSSTLFHTEERKPGVPKVVYLRDECLAEFEGSDGTDDHGDIVAIGTVLGLEGETGPQVRYACLICRNHLEGYRSMPQFTVALRT
jgi:hypothetical protein